MAEDLAGRKAVEQVLVDVDLGQLDLFHPQLAGQGLQDLLFAGQTHFHDLVIEPLAVGVLLRELKLLSRNDVLQQKNLSDVHEVGSSCECCDAAVRNPSILRARRYVKLSQNESCVVNRGSAARR